MPEVELSILSTLSADSYSVFLQNDLISAPIFFEISGRHSWRYSGDIYWLVRHINNEECFILRVTTSTYIRTNCSYCTSLILYNFPDDFILTIEPDPENPWVLNRMKQQLSQLEDVSEGKKIFSRKWMLNGGVVTSNKEIKNLQILGDVIQVDPTDFISKILSIADERSKSRKCQLLDTPFELVMPFWMSLAEVKDDKVMLNSPLASTKSARSV